MNIDNLIKYFFSSKESEENDLKHCKFLNANKDISVNIKLDYNIYKLQLKGVPKKKILLNYLKLLCSNKNMFIKIVNDENNTQTNELVGILYDNLYANINYKLIRRYNYFQNKFINEKIKKKKIKINYVNNERLSTIYE